MTTEHELNTKNELLEKLRAYAKTPDDDKIRLKSKIKDTFMNCPELLYSLNNEHLENELFNTDGTINWEGNWDSYFGDKSSIRPFLFIPETQTDINHYICYQVSFKELPEHNRAEKRCLITFTVFVDSRDAIDKLTGIPRHDLIACIIRENIAWSGITMSNATPVQEIENTTDNSFLICTLVYEAIMPNNLVRTDKYGRIKYVNKGKI